MRLLKKNRHNTRSRSRKQIAGQSSTNLAPAEFGSGPKPFQTVGNTFGSSPQQASAQALEQSSSRQAEMNKSLSGGSDTSRATYVVPSFSDGGTGPMSATNTSVLGNKTLVEHQANSVYDKYAFVGGRRRRRHGNKRSRRTRRRSRRTNSKRNRSRKSRRTH